MTLPSVYASCVITHHVFKTQEGYTIIRSPRYASQRIHTRGRRPVVAVCTRTHGMRMHVHVHMEDARPEYADSANTGRLGEMYGLYQVHYG